MSAEQDDERVGHTPEGTPPQPSAPDAAPAAEAEDAVKAVAPGASAPEPTDDEAADDEADSEEESDAEDEVDSEASEPVVGAPPSPPSVGARLARTAYWGGWFFAAPALFAAAALYTLSPSGSGEVGALGTLVREQPVPVAIVAFALAAAALWAARFKLPGHTFAFVALPEGVSEAHRAFYERAQLLSQQGHALLKARRARVSASGVAATEKGLAGLDAALAAAPYHEARAQKAFERTDELLTAHFGAFRKSEGRESLEQYAIALTAALLLRAFVFEAFRIPSSSMVPTVQTGDHLFVFKASYGPQIPGTSTRLWESMPPAAGDVVVFRFPMNTDIDFIKRVIALPGDVLTARGGHPIINGWEVPSCRLGRYGYVDGEELHTQREGELFVEFLGDESYLTFYDDMGAGRTELQGPFTVPPGEVYVMGDNRHNSQDSRFWWNGAGGGVPFAHLKGRAAFIWLSVGQNGVEWSRMGKRVMGQPLAPRGRPDLQAQLDACMAQRPAVTTPPR